MLSTSRRRRSVAIAVVAAMSLVAASCGDDDDPGGTGGSDGTEQPSGTEAPDGTEAGSEGSAQSGGDTDARESEWYDEAEYELQLGARDETPEGPEGEPWVQAIGPEPVDTSEYAMEGPATVCFSNVDVGNPWRVVGFTNMEQEVMLHEDKIDDFVVRDAGGSQEQQIADIEQLVSGGNCDLLIVSPASTAALTPAVEAACEELPVIVFDRGVNTDCPVTFIKPIGGYAFGADAGEFLVENLEEGDRVLALRILPGVDVLETRWVAGQIAMEEGGLEIIDNVFTDGSPEQTKSIIQDYLDRGEEIDGIWMDAGATAVAAIEAFEENGVDVPVITGEDQQDFLKKWQDEDLTAMAPTYPTYQWRTPVIAADMVLSGEEIPGGDWLLPQPTITEENIGDYYDESMPPLFYALCGCQDMPNFPEAWTE